MSLLDLPRPVKTYHQGPYTRLAPETSTFSGTGKTILITGGATGVGRTIATSFAKTGISRIIIISRSPGPQKIAKQDLETTFPGVQVLTFQAAMTDGSQIERIFREVGKVDILILSAAGSHDHIPTLDIPLSEIADTFSTNIIGNFTLVRAYLEQPSPAAKTIINVSSGAAHITLPGQSAYGPSKAGFAHMIQALAQEFTPEKDNVRMLSFHPGAFLTEMAQKVGYRKDSMPWEDIRIAGDFAVWLASDESKFLNGRFVWAQWDVDELIALKERVAKEPAFLTLGLVM